VTRPSWRWDLGASAAVAGFSLAVAAGFARVFTGWEFLNDMIIVILVGHGAGLLLRRRSMSSWIAVPLGALAVAWTIAALFYPDTFAWGLPTSTTWDVFQAELTEVRQQFSTAVAPVFYGAGWDVLAAIGLGLAVVLADVFAFRALARAETLVPGGVLFVFVGAVGDDRLRITLTVVLVGAGVATTAVLRSYHQTMGGRAAAAVPLRRVWPAIVATTVIVAAAAGFVGPRLPGADAAPLYETRGRGGGVTEVVSPLVDIRSRLTNRSDNELFRVRAGFESYWRSSALPEFDGTTWRLPERPLASVDATLAAPRSGAVELRQQIEIVGLGGSLVPAAPDPFQATGPDDLRWVAETSTLVTVDDDLASGDVIDVVSASPRFEPEALAAATSTDAGDPIYTDVPDDLPDSVADAAVQVTDGTSNAYDAARTLQTWFQTEFDYSLEVQSGHGNNAIETFLRERIGYCEQFAGTFAAMMRTLGYPSRVAVGFTSGTEVAPGTFSVLGRNAHAWPEVWFDDLGWVLFEPTPGRGAPGAENYTGLAAQQDTTPAPDAAADDTATPPTTIARTANDEAGALNIPEEFTDPSGSDSSADATTATSDQSDPRSRWALVLLPLAALVAAPPIARRVRSRTSGHSPERQLARLWSRSLASLAEVGVPVAASQTPLETAAVTADHFPIVGRPTSLLAEAVTTATYRREGAAGYDVVGAYGSSTMRNCRNWAKQIDRAVHDSASLSERVRRYFTDWG
jgi:transglutaminase-like putative cysteine protease